MDTFHTYYMLLQVINKTLTHTRHSTRFTSFCFPLNLYILFNFWVCFASIHDHKHNTQNIHETLTFPLCEQQLQNILHADNFPFFCLFRSFCLPFLIPILIYDLFYTPYLCIHTNIFSTTRNQNTKILFPPFDHPLFNLSSTPVVLDGVFCVCLETAHRSHSCLSLAAICSCRKRHRKSLAARQYLH